MAQRETGARIQARERVCCAVGWREQLLQGPRRSLALFQASEGEQRGNSGHLYCNPSRLRLPEQQRRAGNGAPESQTRARVATTACPSPPRAPCTSPACARAAAK